MMKIRHLFLLMFLWPVKVLAQLPETSIVVKGHIIGLEDGITMQMMEGNGEQYRLFFHKGLPDDNGVVKDNRFNLVYVYRDTVPGLFYLSLPDVVMLVSDLNISFYANPGDTVYVEGKGKLPVEWKIKSACQKQKELSVFNQSAHQEQLAYQKALLDYKEYRLYRRNTDMTEEEWDQSGKLLEAKKKNCDSLKVEWQLARLEAMKTLPVTSTWMQSISVLCDSFTNEKVKWKIKDLYNLRMREINRFPDGKRISNLLYPSPIAELGKKAVDGEMMDMQGNVHRLSDFKGKYVLLDFWSTGCGPCVAAIPEMKKFKERHPDMEIVSLCLDLFDSWKNHKAYKNLPWYNLNDGGGWLGLAKNYGVRAVPTYILISPEGNYVNKWVGQDIFGVDGVLKQLLYPALTETF